MPITTVVLTEDTLTDADVEHILSLHPDDTDAEYRVLVPADADRNLVTSIIDHLGMGELREAWDEIVGRDATPEQAVVEAAERLHGSLTALESAGAQAHGEVTDEDPVPALEAAVRAHGGPDDPAAAEMGVRDVVVVTYPHAVEDTFHRDWASRARDVLHVPVLHLYAGTSRIG